MAGNSITLLDATVTDAVTGGVSDAHTFFPDSVSTILMQSNFTYGSGGTTAKVWLQTSLDDGETWIDIIGHAFATANGRKVSAVERGARAEDVAVDGALADDSELGGVIGDRLRLKYTTTGTYDDDTTLKVSVILG